MKIHIPEGTDKDDVKIIELLGLDLRFQKRIKNIREKFNIPPKGLDAISISFNEHFLIDNYGDKIPVVKEFPKEGSTKSFLFIDRFLDDPDRFLSRNGAFKKDVNSLIKDFNLEKKWYHALCHIVISSSADWLPKPIQYTVQEIRRRNIWRTSGIVLTITRDISKKQLKAWIDKNWDSLRKRLRTDLSINKKNNIPKDKYFNILKEIVNLKNEGLSFVQISKKLSKKYEEELDNDIKLSKLLDSPKAIEDRYYRYLKLVGSNPQKK